MSSPIPDPTAEPGSGRGASQGSLPEVMEAAWIAERGPAEAIHYSTLPVPRPGPTDVVVEVDAVAVNAVDTFVRSGRYDTALAFPFVVGRDVVGRVATCGPGVIGFAVGERVWSNSLGHGGRQGPSAQYALVPVDRLYHLPDQVDPFDAVAVVHPAASAYLALVVHGRLRAGATVLVAGAADLEACRALGAEAVFDYRASDLALRLRREVGGEVDVHLDTSGRHDLDLAVELSSPRGRIVVMAGMGARPELPVGPLYTKDVTLTGFAISSATVAELAEAAERVNQLLEGHALTPRLVQRLPLSAATEAHRRLETASARGVRLVLVPGG